MALLLLLGCGGAQSPAPQPAPTEIGASDALREEERRADQGPAATALAEMAEADLTTEEGREVLSLSAASTLAVTTMVMVIGGVTETPPNDCYAIERSERDGTQVVDVRADDCPGRQADGQRSSGHLTLESRETECGEWAALTLRSWTTSDPRPCGETGSPTGTRVYDGRVVADGCQGLITVDLVFGGEGLEKIDDECRPVRRTAMRYRLSHRGKDAPPGSPMSGEGEVGIGGVGRAFVETIDETIDRECRTEAASGVTRARAAGHVAEVRYDGATDCSDPGSAPLFLDGEPAGTTEHACAAGGSGPVPFAPLLLLLVFRRSRVDG